MIKYIYLIGFLLVFSACHKNKEKTEQEKYAHFYFDYEDAVKNGFQNAVYKETSISGTYSNLLDKTKPYGLGEKHFISELECPDFSTVNFQAWIYPIDEKIDAVFVFSIIDTATNKTKVWKGFPVNSAKLKQNNWSQIKGKLEIPYEDRIPGDQIHMYFWNRDTTTFLIDDLEVSLCSDFNAGNSFFYDLENDLSFKKSHTITNEDAYSGKFSSKVSGKDSYSISIEKPITDIYEYKQAHKVGLSCWIKSTTPEINAVLVFSLYDTITGNSDYWQGQVVENQYFNTKNWTKISAEFLLPDSLKKSEKFQVYIWNRKGNKLFVDDFYIVFKTKHENTIEPYVDLTKGKYETQKKINFPPFQKHFFTKNSDFELSLYQGLNAKKILTLLPGKFKSQNFQNLILSGDNSMYFLNSKEFKQEVDLHNFVDALSLNVDADKEDELIIAQKNKLLVGNYNSTKKQFDLGEIVFNKEIKAITAYKNELVIANSDGLCFYTISERKCSELLKHKNLETIDYDKFHIKLVSGNFYSKNKLAVIAIFSDSTQNIYKEITIENKHITDVKNGLTIGVDTLKVTNNYFIIDSNNDGVDELLKYDPSWRFDLKQIHFTDNYFIIDKIFDFKGFEKDLNPKFYENFSLYKIKSGDAKIHFLVHGYNTPSNMEHPYFDKINDFPETIEIYAY